MKAPFGYVGGKARQAKWLAEFVDGTSHNTYAEPFCGAASVFFAKKPSKIEILNDKDKRFPLMFQALRDHPKDVAKFAASIEYSKAAFDESYVHLRDPDSPLPKWKLGVWALFQCHASHSGYPDAHSFAWRVKGQDKAKQWLALQESLPKYTSRLTEATMTNYDALEFLGKTDKDGVLVYCDPPYFGSEKRYRVAKGFDHEKFAEILLGFKKAKVILSHYATPPYSEWSSEWRFEERKSTQSCRGSTSDSPTGDPTVSEGVWLNFVPASN